MKAEILKIAGVKSEKEFYKKYPTEEAFMKAHGKKFKKAEMGSKMVKTQLKQLTDFGNPPEAADGMMMDSSSMTMPPVAPVAPIGSYMGGEAIGFNPINFHKNYYGLQSQITGDPYYIESIAQDRQQARRQNVDSVLNSLSSMTQKAAGGGQFGSGDPMLTGMGSADFSGGLQWSNPTGLNGMNPYNAYTPNYNVVGTSGQTTQTNPGGISQPNKLYTTDPNQIGKDPKTKKPSSNNLMKGLGVAGGIIEGVRGLKDEKQQMLGAKQTKAVSDLTLQADSMRPEMIKRKYVRPEDVVVNPNELFPTYGVGTNYLSRNGSVVRAEDGMQIGGNLGEIQNTYAPNTLYDDLGFEPLNDSSQVKQYMHGGWTVPRAAGGISEGFMKFNNAGGDNVLNSLANIAGGNNAGSQLGGAVAGGIKMIPGVGPIAGAIADPALRLIGGLLDPYPRKTKKFQDQTSNNLLRSAFMSGAQGLQGQNAAFMQDGGYVSHNWNPQVITKFGDVDVSQIHNIATQGMDSLRTGGHITQNQMFPTDKYAFGGSLKTTWGGHTETMSHNPYLPGTGETVMFRGKSHEEGDGKGHTGIGVKYGEGGYDSYTDYAEYGSENADADVEVERGEPAAEMIDPKTGEKNMVVYGNLKIPNMFLDLIGDPKAKGKKFKHYVADLSKQEAKQNKIMDKYTNLVDEHNDNTSIGKLALASYKAMMQGANTKLKDIADKKTKATDLQNAINDTAEEFMLDADALAKGKAKVDKNAIKEAMNEQAKYGKMIKKAQDGIATSASEPGESVTEDVRDKLNALYEKAKKTKDPDDVRAFQKLFHMYFPKTAEKIIRNDKHITGKGKSMGYTDKDLKTMPLEDLLKTNEDGFFEERTEQYHAIANAKKTPPAEEFKFQEKTLETPKEDNTPSVQPIVVNPPKKLTAIDYINAMIPYIRPTDQEPLDMQQLYPEMYALATNRLEPVQAQGYQPLLEQPYDISLQDQLNANQADFNAIQKQTGYNPAAAASLSAQKYKANSSVLGEQFRLNQAEKAGVYNRNRATLNDAFLKNLGIYDQQMVRQETAKSRTKETTQAALNSIASKFAQNRLENRTLGVMENLYNYRYDKKGRAINMNPLFQPAIPQVYVPQYSPDGKTIIGYKQVPVTDATTQSTGNQGVTAINPTLTPIEQTTTNANGVPFYLDPNSQPAVQIGPFGFTFPTGSTQKKNGGKTKKDNKNSNIVRAIKNL
jgi:uncharacterized protein (UPF0297 family)